MSPPVEREVEKELEQAVQAVDGAIDDKRTEVEAQRSELTKLHEDRDTAYRTWTEGQTAYDARSAEPAGLPAAVRRCVIRVGDPQRSRPSSRSAT